MKTGRLSTWFILIVTYYAQFYSCCLKDCTYFTRKEILRVQKRFRELDSQRVPEVMTGNEAHTIDVPMEKIEKMSELKENPFRQRICKVFSHDGSGNMTFDDFLDMLSVFSEPSPRDVKVFYAFRIYDYDEDQMLGPSDIEKATVALTRNQLTPEEVQIVVEKVLEEADMDDDGKLSFTEFEHVITRAPDFIRVSVLSGASSLMTSWATVHVAYP